MRSFIISQFSYFSLIWMTYSSGLKNKANNIHERPMRIVYKDFSSSFEGLLAKDYSVTIYTRNMQQLLIETFKVKIRIFPIIMKQILSFRDINSHNLRSGTYLSRPIFHTTHYRTESITNLGANVWELVPQNIKVANFLSSFKNKIKTQIPNNCPCRHCKIHIAQVGFIQIFC